MSDFCSAMFSFCSAPLMLDPQRQFNVLMLNGVV